MRKRFYRCEICRKKLIERLPNGLWKFVFGKNVNDSNSIPPVEMLIFGTVRMRCLRRSCRASHPDHWNELYFFPGKKHINQPEKAEEANAISDESGINIKLN
jgi:hypothetical protein